MNTALHATRTPGSINIGFFVVKTGTKSISLKGVKILLTLRIFPHKFCVDQKYLYFQLHNQAPLNNTLCSRSLDPIYIVT